MIQRNLEKHCKRLAQSYPVVLITGPRQSGKTTLARMAFPKMDYINLEDPSIRKFAFEDPKGLLSRHRNGVIVDEFQKVPDITSFIQPVIDASTKRGLFVLTGSHQFEVMERVSQSLAGRTGMVRLLPFSLNELGKKEISNADKLLYQGFYPRIYHDRLNPTEFLGMYCDTYLHRDLREIVNVADLGTFERFLRLLAGRTAQILDMTGLSNDTGASVPTIKRWLSVLEASYLVFLLPPFFTNISKRLVKRPKVYFYDTGLAAYLCGIENLSHIPNHPLRGALFENMVVTEILKNRFNKTRRSNLFFFRDKNGHEVDLILESGTEMHAVEIKSAQTAQPAFAKNLQYLTRVLPSHAIDSHVLYNGSDGITLKDIEFIPWKSIAKFCDEIT